MKLDSGTGLALATVFILGGLAGCIAAPDFILKIGAAMSPKKLPVVDVKKLHTKS